MAVQATPLARWCTTCSASKRARGISSLVETREGTRVARMGKEQGPDFYDSRMGRVAIRYEDSPWRPIYDAVVDLLPDDRSIRILDIGCGTGRGAEAIRRAGYKNYLGFDFSPSRVAEAARYVPNFRFLTLDVFSAEARDLFAAHDVFVLTEVLEHIEREREVIAMIPARAVVLFSVPNFDSTAHVRTFSSLDALEDRYGDILAIDREAVRILSKEKRPERKTFVCRSVRK